MKKIKTDRKSFSIDRELYDYLKKKKDNQHTMTLLVEDALKKYITKKNLQNGINFYLVEKFNNRSKRKSCYSISLRMDKDIYDILTSIQKEMNIKPSWIIEEAIKEYV